MGGFVGEGLGRGGSGEAGPDGDLACGEVGAPEGGGDIAFDQGEAAGGDDRGEAGVELGRRHAGEDFGAHLGDRGRSDELVLVEDSHDFEALQGASEVLFAGVVVEVARDPVHRGQDEVAGGAACDLTSAAVCGGDVLPGVVAGHSALRALGEEQQDVAEAVVMEPACRVKHGSPLGARRQLRDLANQQLVGRGETRAHRLRGHRVVRVSAPARPRRRRSR